MSFLFTHRATHYHMFVSILSIHLECISSPSTISAVAKRTSRATDSLSIEVHVCAEQSVNQNYDIVDTSHIESMMKIRYSRKYSSWRRALNELEKKVIILIIFTTQIYIRLGMHSAAEFQFINRIWYSIWSCAHHKFIIKLWVWNCMFKSDDGEHAHSAHV